MLALLPYDRAAAVRYAHIWAYGRNPRYYDYEGIGGDCTNFASQCIYAGAGVMNDTPTFGWYYINANDKAPAWTGVEYLYNFLKRRTPSAGPFAGEVAPERIRPGDIVQLSFDGAGWQPLATYEDEVEAMVAPLRRALEADPDSLNGQIIFQKDGCSMSERTPVADALPRQLELLTQYGYRVITVSALLARSPFEDLPSHCPEMDDIRFLLSRGQVIGYRSNTFSPSRRLTADEFYIMAADPAIFRQARPLSYGEMKRLARAYAREQGIDFRRDALQGRRRITRLEAVPLLRALVEARA